VNKPRPKQNWIRNFSRSLTRGRLTLGKSRREPRSQRVRLEAIAAAPDLHQDAPRSWVPGWLKQNLLIAGVVALLAVVSYGLFGTDWFYIYDIEVAGNQLISKEEIYTRSNLEGLHLFWLNPDEVTARLKEEPLIEGVQIAAFPPNQVRITVQERQPTAVWQSNGQSYFVDGTGTLFSLRGDASTMMVIRNLSDDAVNPGETIDSSIVQAAIALNQLIPERTAFDWAPGLGIGYLNEYEYWVHFGDYTRLNAKVAAYRAFIDQIQNKPEPEEITLLDLSVPEHPYYKVAP
jgi:cell division septal protein FtsQ